MAVIRYLKSVGEEAQAFGCGGEEQLGRDRASSKEGPPGVITARALCHFWIRSVFQFVGSADPFGAGAPPGVAPPVPPTPGVSVFAVVRFAGALVPAR